MKTQFVRVMFLEFLVYVGFLQIIGAQHSCEGRCDEKYKPNLPCYCNEACMGYENCCYDYIPLCNPRLLTNDSWAVFNGHMYKYTEDGSSTAVSANQSCREMGALLVSINTKEEFDFVSSEVLRWRTLSAFIGGNDILKEGNWVWEDGTSMPLPGSKWHAWFEGEPDNDKDVEHCSIITNYYKYWTQSKIILKDYSWKDYMCKFNAVNEIQGYICEGTGKCQPNPCRNGGSCFYTGQDPEFECACPNNFVGDVCQYEVKENEIWTICGETNLTSAEGVITSPLYPKNYPPNTRCKWYITAEEESTVSIKIDTVHLENSKHCQFDYLSIYDDHCTNKTKELLDPVCGGPSNDITVSTSSNKALVVFNTDMDVQKTGFKLSYSHHICGQGTGNSGCGTVKTFTSQCGEINVTYRADIVSTECDWTIQLAPGQKINISFSYFNLKDAGQDCASDGLEIYEKDGNKTHLLGRYCGRRAPFVIYSNTNHIDLKLTNTDLLCVGKGFHIQYQIYNSTEFQLMKNNHTVQGMTGSLNICDTYLYSSSPECNVYKWHIQVPYGYHMYINWCLKDGEWAKLKIYKGFGNSVLLDEHYNFTIDSLSENLSISYFQAVVLLNVDKYNIPNFTLTYMAKEWTADYSNCFRPLYYHNTSSVTTENNVITNLDPVMMKISNSDVGYSADMYCKWLIKGQQNKTFLIDIINANIYPMTKDCRYDGLVIYDGPNPSYPALGPFCGQSSLEGNLLLANKSELLVVFYSDPDYCTRTDGKFRALIKQDCSDCPVWNMEAPSSQSFTASCGIILSPNFPGVVQQGLWYWRFKAPPDHYISLKVHYVSGPNTTDADCGQSLKIIEIPKDSTMLRQYEKDIIKLCGSTNLFIPPTLIKLPPNQKMGIELNTVINALPQKWQFKMSFTSHVMEKPKTCIENGTCPAGYTKWRGNCYRYFAWAERHYNESYNWQQTWQGSLQHCQSENATLLTIYDEEEAYFLKYKMATCWFWDPATPYSLNHRLIYLGLKRMNTDIKWINDVELSYADWYKQRPSWMQNILYKDSTLTEIFNPSVPQPSAGVGSLCTGILPLSPFESLNWIKIPCDYPMFRAGAICKKPVERPVEYKDTAELPDHGFQSTYEVCPEGFFMVDGKCLTMITNYSPNTTKAVDCMSVYNASCSCKYNNSELSTCTNMTIIKDYLHIWNHTTIYGDVLVANDSSNICKIIKVESIDNQVSYREVEINCKDVCSDDFCIGNVVCSIPSINVKEICGPHEFTCTNGACVSVDSVCDSLNDCGDNSDEVDCKCGESEFQCDNGKCVSVSLRCDFVDNCGDMSDEKNCVQRSCRDDEFECKNKECILLTRTCNFIYDCTDKSDEDPTLCGGRCNGFQCYSGTCLDKRLEKDGISDCPGLLFEDEAYRSNDLKTTTDLEQDNTEEVKISQVCNDGGQFVKCSHIINKCYDRSKACVYDTVVMDEVSQLQVQDSCRDGYHIRTNCEKIQCPGLFHCPQSYCIPLRKVCDGRTDCPQGHDEKNCHNYKCPGFFKCKSTGICIPHSEVCNGISNCGPHKDDEKYCGEIDPVCSLCSCKGNIACCANRELSSLPVAAVNKTRSLRALFLDKNKLHLSHSTFTGLHWLNKLTIRDNKLIKLIKNGFYELSNLEELDISNNWISLLEPNCFNGLGQLKMLNLSYNKLKILFKESFNKLVSLKRLVIEHNPDLLEIDPSTFTQLYQLQTLNADAYKFCCIAPQVDVCTPAADEFSDCKDLMANYTLQMCIWILGITATVGNLFVVIWRIITDHSKVSSMFIINLGCSDFLMGCYMIIIAVTDQYYRGSYIIHADKWKSSTLCQIAGVLAMFSAELSVYMLTAITLDRCLAIMFPFKFGKFRMKHARYIVILGWIVCFCLSVLPLTDPDYFGKAFFGSTGVCLPFHISHERRPGWEYSVFIFFVLNLMSFVIIFISYAALFISVRASIKTVGEKATGTADDYALAKKLVIIVATDFCCWVPIILIGFAALGGATISPQVSAWIAVFILPLNSAVNPILYTISSIDCNKKKKQKQRSTYYSTTASTKLVSTVSGIANVNYNPKISITSKEPPNENGDVNNPKKITLDTDANSTNL